MEFAYDGGGLAKGGTVTLYIDGKAVGNGRLEQTIPMVFSADETSDVGVKHGSPMKPDMPRRRARLRDVEPSSSKLAAKTDHLLDREEVMNMIMARQ